MKPRILLLATALTLAALTAGPVFAADSVPATAAPTTVAPAAAAAPIQYTVWAFQLKDGAWVKDESYSWTTPDPVAASAYVAKIQAVPGWTATTNSPIPAPPVVAYAPAPRRDFGGGTMTFNIGGYSITVPRGAMNPNAQSVGPGEYSTDWEPVSDPAPDTSVQDSLALQDQINQQIQNDNLQDQLNMQNFINTENWVNDQNAQAAAMINPPMP